ncbi:MAG TPA: S-layer homology domain-containing protein, partial [Clostridiaceae bacterium]|nr:S-layer homology domain-containing protein [Clostridiaceae bacterium]
VRALGLKADFSSNFDDVSPDSYYYEGVGIARALGIAKGTGGNLFNPKAELTREDMMVLAARALRIAGKLKNEGTFDDIKHFDDADEVSSYAVESVAALVKAGIIKGDGKSINPKATATRAEAAIVIYRIYQLVNALDE